MGCENFLGWTIYSPLRTTCDRCGFRDESGHLHTATQHEWLSRLHRISIYAGRPERGKERRTRRPRSSVRQRGRHNDRVLGKEMKKIMFRFIQFTEASTTILHQFIIRCLLLLAMHSSDHPLLHLAIQKTAHQQYFRPVHKQFLILSLPLFTVFPIITIGATAALLSC